MDRWAARSATSSSAGRSSTSTSSALDPERAARALIARGGDGVFPLSEQFGAWRVVLDRSRTVDFAPLQGGSIEADLALRDFTVNAIAVPLPDGEPVDPFDGRGDVGRRVLRVVSDRVFDDDPLRLLRAVRFEDELGFRLDGDGEALVRAKAGLVTKAAGERTLEELRVLSPAGLRAGGRARPARAPRRAARPAACARSTRSGSASRSRSART